MLDAFHESELDDASIVKGLRLRRVAREADKDVKFVSEVLMRHQSMVSLHSWLHSENEQGRELPTTLEDAQDKMARDPRASAYAGPSKQLRTFQRRMARRG